MGKKTFIVGDVHGCFDEFLALLKKAKFDLKRDRLILVGDVINRGPKSFEMLKWVKENEVEMVRGNHEQNFLDQVRSGEMIHSFFKDLKKKMGKDLKKWIEWMEKLPFYIEEEEFLVVHAGLKPKTSPKNTNPYILTNIRCWDGVGEDLRDDGMNPPWHKFYKGKKLVIYGHWASQGLRVKDNTVGLDSGCVYGRMLSGIWLPSLEVVQVKARKTYYSSY